MEIRLSNYYQPLPRQAIFHESDAKYKCYMGGVGSGKTTALVMEALILSLEYPGNYGLIGRYTYPELRDTTMYEFFNVLNQLPDSLVKEWRKTENKLTLANDSVIIFRHLEEPDKLKSLNLGFFAIDEMTEVPEDVWDMLKTRLRKREVGRHVGFGTTNPEGHDWVWETFCKRYKDNPKYLFVQAPTTENPYLPTDYVDDLVVGMPQYWIDRFIKGSPTAFAGQILNEWNEDIHVIEPFEVPETWSRAVVLDHGTNNPTAVLWFAVDPEANVIVYKEHYKAGEVIERHAEKIFELNGSDNVDLWLADPAIFNLTLQDPKRGLHSVADRYAEYGIHFAPGDNDVKDGIQVLLKYFKIYPDRVNPFTQKLGSPRIFITRNCEWTIHEVPQYRWKGQRVRGRGKNKPEEPEKDKDHTVDDIRYFLMSHPQPSKARMTNKYKDFLSREERIWNRLERISKAHAKANPGLAYPFDVHDWRQNVRGSQGQENLEPLPKGPR